MDLYLELAQRALMLILYVSLPALIASLAVGVIISLLQALTQVQEQTLTFVPKAIVTVLTLVLLGHVLMNMLKEFADELFSQIHTIGA